MFEDHVRPPILSLPSSNSVFSPALMVNWDTFEVFAESSGRLTGSRCVSGCCEAGVSCTDDNHIEAILRGLYLLRWLDHPDGGNASLKAGAWCPVPPFTCITHLCPAGGNGS